MTVNITAVKDLVDTATGTTVVSSGSRGTIVGFEGPPNLRFQAEFSVFDSTVTRWVYDHEISFDTGDAGKLQAVAELDQKVVKSVEYPNVISSTELFVGNQFTYDRTVMRVNFQDGLSVDFVSDLNTGEIRLRFVV